MCLIAFSFKDHPNYPLIFAGNRDESHVRPTSIAKFWDDHPDVLAGRDLEAGGTWLGINRAGRFATVTNFREPSEHRPGARTRGELVSGYLLGADTSTYLQQLERHAGEYNGFNLILGDGNALYYLSNMDGPATELSPGLYGLSNGLLDTPWPKVQRAKELFAGAIDGPNVDPDALLDMLEDRVRPIDDDLPNTGIGIELERIASSIFIDGMEYGTRASTVVMISTSGEVTFVERSFGPAGVPTGTQRFHFRIEG